VARVANHSGLVAVATAALVITVSLQEPPLVATPPPEADETPEDAGIPDVMPDEDESLDDVPVDEDEPPVGRCGSAAVMCANLAPTRTAPAAASTPTRRVIFLTFRRPSSRAKAALEYWDRVTRSGSSVILCDQAEPLLPRVRVLPVPEDSRRPPVGPDFL